MNYSGYEFFSLFFTLRIKMLAILHNPGSLSFMKINLWLRRNSLGTETEAPFLPVMVRNGNLRLDDLYNEVANRTTLTRPDVKGVMESMLEVVMKFLAKGLSVTTDIGVLSPSVSGSFESRQDRFNPAKHSVRIRFRVNPAIVNYILDNASIQVVNAPQTAPKLFGFLDAENESETQTSAGSLVRIEGSELNFDRSDADQGIFLIADSDSLETKIGVIGEQNSTRIVLQIPATIAAGQYFLVVRKRYGQQLREGRLLELVEVV